MHAVRCCGVCFAFVGIHAFACYGTGSSLLALYVARVPLLICVPVFCHLGTCPWERQSPDWRLDWRLEIANRAIGVPGKGEATECSVFLLNFPVGGGNIRAIDVGDRLRAAIAHHQF